MELANIRITSKDGMVSEVVVNGMHLEHCVQGLCFVQMPGEAPSLHLELAVDEAEIETAGDCTARQGERLLETDEAFWKLLYPGGDVTVDACAPDPDAGYFHG